MDLNKTHKEEIAFLVKHADKNLPEVLRMFAKDYHTKQLLIADVVGQSEQLPCGHKQVELVRHAAKCKDCGTVFETKW